MAIYFDKVIASPINYVGGKKWITRDLLSLIPEGITKVVSPFCGGMAFELNAAIRRYEVSASDIDINLCNFWLQWFLDAKAIDYIGKQLIKAHSRDELIELKKARIMSVETLAYPHHNACINAAWFYAHTRLGFANKWTSNYVKHIGIENGILYYDKHKERVEKSNKDRVRERPISGWTNKQFLFPSDNNGARGDIHKRLDLSQYADLPITVARADFREVLPSIPDDVFLYCDPPYWGSENLYKGGKGFDHERLASELETVACPFVISYNDCEWVRERYKRYRWLEVRRPKALRSVSDDRDELIVVSDAIQLPAVQEGLDL